MKTNASVDEYNLIIGQELQQLLDQEKWTSS